MKQEPSSDLEDTNFVENEVIHKFSHITTDKMAQMRGVIRSREQAFEVAGKDPRTTFRVLLWVLDLRRPEPDGMGSAEQQF